MSGIDRSADGDLDRFSGREDRPFPGAPDDREPVSAPGPAPSMEQMRAAYANAGSNRDIEASAKADEAAAARGSGTGIPDPGSSEEGRTEVGGNCTAPGARPGVQDAGADGTAVRGTGVPGGVELDGERTGPGSRTSADMAPEPEADGGSSGDKDGEGQRDDGQERKPKDLLQAQDPAPEAETDRPVEAAAEAAPDQQPDDPRWAAMETRMAEFASMFESMQAKLDASQARNEELEAKVGDLETARQEDQAKISELEARVKGPDTAREQDGPVEDNEQTESLLNPDVLRADEREDGLNVAEQADDTELSNAAADRTSREVNEAPSEEAERPGLSEDTAQAGQDALSLAGSLGIVNPLVSLAVSADSARRKFQKMAPAEQLDVINLTDSAAKAFGSMPPGTAVVAVTVGTVAPLVGGKVRNTIHHFRRKD